MSKTITISDDLYNALLKEKEEYRQRRNQFKRDTDSDEKEMLRCGWEKPSFELVIKHLLEAVESNSDLYSEHDLDCLCDECTERRNEIEEEHQQREAQEEHIRFMSEVYGHD